MYEFMILSQLMQGNAHGYLIAKIINDIIGPYARVSSGRLYPLLTKLEQSGLIAIVEETESEAQGNRQLRIYTITDAGRMRFRVLMNNIDSNTGDYRELFLLKVCAFSHITPLERLRLIDHYINYCQSHIFHQQTELEDMVRNATTYQQGFGPYQKGLGSDYLRLDSSGLERILEVMQHMIEQWEQELDWARSLRERELVRAQQDGMQKTTKTEEHVHE